MIIGRAKLVPWSPRSLRDPSPKISSNLPCFFFAYFGVQASHDNYDILWFARSMDEKDSIYYLLFCLAGANHIMMATLKGSLTDLLLEFIRLINIIPVCILAFLHSWSSINPTPLSFVYQLAYIILWFSLTKFLLYRRLVSHTPKILSFSILIPVLHFLTGHSFF